MSSLELISAVEENKDVGDLLEEIKCNLEYGFGRAINKNNLENITYFLNSDILNLEKLDGSQKFPGGVIYEALGNYDENTIKLLLSVNKFNPGFVDPNNYYPYTALMLMCDYGYERDEEINIVTMLLKTGKANPEFTNQYGESALSLAKQNETKKLEKLIKKYIR